MAVSRMSLVLGALALGGGGCALIDALAFGEETETTPLGEGGSAAHGGAGHGGSGGTGGTGGTGGMVFEQVKLFAIHPPIMTHGGAVWLEGEFDPSDSTAEFVVGGGDAEMTVRSTHRATLEIPDPGAFTGDLVIFSGETQSWPLPLRVTPFGLGITLFQDHYPQTAYGRAMPVLDEPRPGHTAHVLGQHVYLVGGGDEARLARAQIHADGALSRFSTDGTASLSPARSGHMSLRLVDGLYVLGGEANGTALTSVERADLDPDTNAPMNFSPHGDVVLIEARVDGALAVVGRYAYVFGGLDESGNPLASIERAAYSSGNPRGIGPFEPLVGETLATARAGHTVVVAGEHLFVIGGRGPGGPLASVEMFRVHDSGAIERSDQVPNLVAARQDHTSILLGNQLYVLGGRGSGGEVDSVERAVVGSDGTLQQQFATLDFNMAEPRAGASSVVAGNDLYLLGGTVGGNETVSISRASLAAEAELGSWEDDGLALNEERADHLVAVSSRRLHVLGGARGQGGAWPNDLFEGAEVAADGTQASGFSQGSEWDAARRGACMAVIADKMWVFGGEDEQDFSRLAEYGSFGPNNEIGTFSIDPSVELTAGRRDAACVVLKDRLYMVGGEDTNGAMATVQFLPFDQDGMPTGTWTDVAVDDDLVTARSGHAVAVLGNRLYVIGGTNDGVSAIPGADAVEVALIGDGGSLDPFVTYSTDPVMDPRAHPATAIVGSWLYVLGGAGASPSSYVQRAAFEPNGSGAIGGFHTAPSNQLMPTNRQRHAAILLSNQLHVLGGYQDGAGGGGTFLQSVINAQMTGP